MIIKNWLITALILSIFIVCDVGASTSENVTSLTDDNAASQFVASYIANLRKSQSASFYSSCRLHDSGMTSVIMPIGSSEGLFVEKSGGTIVNTAAISWTDGRWRTEVAQGGIYTITRANNLIMELLGSSFHIAKPGLLIEMINAIPKSLCREKTPQ